MLRRIFVHKKNKKEKKENYIMTCTLPQILLGYEEMKYEIGGVCCTHEREAK
jgi:hypothetical protein